MEGVDDPEQVDDTVVDIDTQIKVAARIAAIGVEGEGKMAHWSLPDETRKSWDRRIPHYIRLRDHLVATSRIETSVVRLQVASLFATVFLRRDLLLAA